MVFLKGEKVMGKKNRKDPFPWQVVIICLTVIFCLGTAIYFFGGKGADKRIAQLEKQTKEEYTAHLDCKTKVSQLDQLLAEEKKKFGQVEWKYKKKDMERQAYVEKLIKNKTFTEKQLVPFFKLKKCVGNQCWMKRIDPK